jgi:hypothetical protein
MAFEGVAILEQKKNDLSSTFGPTLPGHRVLAGETPKAAFRAVGERLPCPGRGAYGAAHS